MLLEVSSRGVLCVLLLVGALTKVSEGQYNDGSQEYQQQQQGSYELPALESSSSENNEKMILPGFGNFGQGSQGQGQNGLLGLFNIFGRNMGRSGQGIFGFGRGNNNNPVQGGSVEGSGTNNGSGENSSGGNASGGNASGGNNRGRPRFQFPFQIPTGRGGRSLQSSNTNGQLFNFDLTVPNLGRMFRIQGTESMEIPGAANNRNNNMSGVAENMKSRFVRGMDGVSQEFEAFY